jgi:hypothetical protein
MPVNSSLSLVLSEVLEFLKEAHRVPPEAVCDFHSSGVVGHPGIRMDFSQTPRSPVHGVLPAVEDHKSLVLLFLHVLFELPLYSRGPRPYCDDIFHAIHTRLLYNRTWACFTATASSQPCKSVITTSPHFCLLIMSWPRPFSDGAVIMRSTLSPAFDSFSWPRSLASRSSIFLTLFCRSLIRGTLCLVAPDNVQVALRPEMSLPQHQPLPTSSDSPHEEDQSPSVIRYGTAPHTFLS